MPTRPPTTAVKASRPALLGRIDRPPVAANTSVATGTVIAPISSSDGKYAMFWVVIIAWSTTR